MLDIRDRYPQYGLILYACFNGKSTSRRTLIKLGDFLWHDLHLDETSKTSFDDASLRLETNHGLRLL